MQEYGSNAVRSPNFQKKLESAGGFFGEKSYF